jgi:hypothetical protein
MNRFARRAGQRLGYYLDRSLLVGLASWVVIVGWSTFTGLPAGCRGQSTGASGPSFRIQGASTAAATLNHMRAQHRATAFSDCTLWDRWLPAATLWGDMDAVTRYRRSLLNRRIDDEGYVAMQQHRGMAHSDGWPFPAWQQSTGVGFHFSLEHDVWAIQNFRSEPLRQLDEWTIAGGTAQGIDPSLGLQVRCDDDIVEITTPSFQCGTIVAPFARLEWGISDWPKGASAQLHWRIDDQTFSNDCQEFFPQEKHDRLHYVNLPLYRQPTYSGMLKQYRLRLTGVAGAIVHLKSIITAIDTRHPITNANYLRACNDYLRWTADHEFLVKNLPRMRAALGFMIREFGLVEHRHVVVPWVGHDGRSGLVWDANGRKQLRPGLGVGNNYWDLLPFGGHDALATIYAQDALIAMAEIEQIVAELMERDPETLESLQDSNIEWTAVELRSLADQLKQEFQTRFWNADTGRFVGWIDRQGNAYDYGFTFVNLEAIHYGLATSEQSARVFAWLDGTRLVVGDTSQGPDIYHWRFAPRATTRRNVETYVWAWSAPESIEWGGQVQDGGAVLGFSYHDIMARIKVQGPDQAWERLKSICEWYNEVQAEGGYRAYYAKPDRGTLQGGGTAGGLGLDFEFMESILVPQVMLDGFAGFRATAEGYECKPQLPKAWESLTIEDVMLHGKRYTLTVYQDGHSELAPLQP